jgi:hypothetical protein
MALYPKYVPDFKIRINDEPLPAVLRAGMSGVSYQDGLEGADRVEVTFANPDLRWLDHSLLQVDNGFRLSLGYLPDTLEEVFVGEITGVEPSFPSGGMPAIKVVAHDFLQRLTHGTKDRGFRINLPSIGNYPLPEVLVAPIVSGVNLLIPALDPVGGALSILMAIATYAVAPQLAQLAVPLQVQQSDFDFLAELSKKNGWEMFIDHTLEPRGRVLRFQSLMQDYAPSLTLKYGASLMDFNPRLTTVGDIFGVAARIWVPTLQTEFVIIVSWDYDRAAFNLSIYPNLIGDLDEILGPAAGGKTLSIAPVGFPLTLPKILTELLPRLNNRLTGSGSTAGDPRIKAGKVINLQGLGEQFSGLYRITTATHTFDSGGYRTNFEVRKEIWFGSIPVPKGTSGLVRLQGQTIV